MSTAKNAEFKQRSAYFKQRRRQCRLIKNQPNTTFISAANGKSYYFDDKGTVHVGAILAPQGLLGRIRGMFRA